MTLTDPQWAVLAPLVRPATDPGAPRPNGRPLADPRPILQGILWILDTGAKWKDLPEVPGRYAPRSTCHRWLQKWSADGTWTRVAEALAAMALEAGKLDLREGFVDATFAPAKKGAPASDARRRARAPRS